MILDQFKLDGKVALVTGAAKGLGRAIAVALAEAGADIAVVDRLDCSETGNEIIALDRRFFFHSCDLRSASVSQVNGVVERVVVEMGRLDILVNSAGIIRRAPALDLNEVDWDDVIQVNLKALFFLSQAAAKVMLRQRSGRIINIASMLSFQGGILVPSYAAAKSGVAGVTRALANELGCHGITVNAIAPGYMTTDNSAILRGDSSQDSGILARIPLARWGTPDDIKGMVVLLASPAAAYITGAVMTVDGGWLSR